MNEITKVIRCEVCKFSQSFIDPFNGKKRYACGLNQTIEVGGFGDEALMMDNGCENGERR